MNEPQKKTARVTFQPDGLTVDVPIGKNLREVCEEHECGIPFSCKEGNCGTCMSSVLEGAENLSEQTESEKSTLSSITFEHNYRLVCQCKVKKPGKIVIKQGVQ